MKTVKSLIATLIVSSMLLCIPAAAFPWDTAAASVGSAIQAGLESYDISVIQRMVGRAGAYTPTGSKGIAFEIKLMDQMNLKNLFTELSTSLSESSTDTVSDLITKNASGEVVDWLQCKAATSDSGINNIVNQVSSGKYDTTRLVGTSECAEAFNAKGLSVTMEDTGISTKSVERTAERFLDHGKNATQALNALGKAAVIAAVIKGTMAVAESVKRGDSISELIGHVMTETPKGAVTGVAAFAAGQGATVVMISLLGVSNPVILVIGGAAASIAAAVPVELGLDKLADMMNVEEKMTEWTTVAIERARTIADDAASKVNKIDLGKSISRAVSNAASSVRSIWYSAAK